MIETRDKQGLLRSVLGSLAGLLLCVGCADWEDGLEAPSSLTVSATSSYPAVARLIGPGGSGLCTGAFVSPRVLLTAAHCTQTPGVYTVASSSGYFRSSEIQPLGAGALGDPSDISLVIFSRDVADPELDEIVSIGLGVRQKERVRLVGFGCNNLEKKSGSGRKRTGTNQVYRRANHIELLSPNIQAGTRGILGPENRAAICFGDSGSPLLRETGDGFEVIGVGHAGAWSTKYIISQYSDLGSERNRNFLYEKDREMDLSLNWSCSPVDPSCGFRSATLEIADFFKWMFRGVKHWFKNKVSFGF